MFCVVGDLPLLVSITFAWFGVGVGVSILCGLGLILLVRLVLS